MCLLLTMITDRQGGGIKTISRDVTVYAYRSIKYYCRFKFVDISTRFSYCFGTIVLSFGIGHRNAEPSFLESVNIFKQKRKQNGRKEKRWKSEIERERESIQRIITIIDQLVEFELALDVATDFFFFLNVRFSLFRVSFVKQFAFIDRVIID